MNKRPELADYHELILLIDDIYHAFGQGHCWHESFDRRAFSKTTLRFCAEKAMTANCQICSRLIPFVETASKLQFKKAVFSKNVRRPGERTMTASQMMKRLAGRVNPT
jgi:hypothetical protein